MKKRYLIFGVFFFAVIASAGLYAFEKLPTGIMASVITAMHTDKRTETEILKLLSPHYEPSVIDSLGQNDSLRIEYKDIDGDFVKDIVVQLTNDNTCGSAGCIREFFIREDDKTLRRVKFALSVHELTFTNTFTQEMRDLYLNGNTETIMIWNGTRYMYK